MKLAVQLLSENESLRKNRTKIILKTVIVFLCLIIYCPLNAAEYYLDANTGDDINGDGSQQMPWRSISKVQNEAAGGDIVYLD